MPSREDQLLDELKAIAAELERRNAEVSKAEAMLLVLTHAFTASLAAAPPKQRTEARKATQAWLLKSVELPPSKAKAVGDGARAILALLDQPASPDAKKTKEITATQPLKDGDDKVVPLRP